MRRESREREEAEEAGYTALRELGGGVEQIKEECRDIGHWIGDFLPGCSLRSADAGQAIPALRMAVITLALGIGAQHRDLQRGVAPHALPIGSLWWRTTRPDGSRSPVSAPTYLDWRKIRASSNSPHFAARVSAFSRKPRPILAERGITPPNFFETFRLRPELGVFFGSGIPTRRRQRLPILSHEIWQTQFGGEADIVGKPIRLNGETYVVVGVAPAGLNFAGGGWMPGCL